MGNNYFLGNLVSRRVVSLSHNLSACSSASGSCISSSASFSSYALNKPTIKKKIEEKRKEKERKKEKKRWWWSKKFLEIFTWILSSSTCMTASRAVKSVGSISDFKWNISMWLGMGTCKSQFLNKLKVFEKKKTPLFYIFHIINLLKKLIESQLNKP